MDSRRVMRFLVGFALLAGPGCSYLPYALPDIGSSLANPVHDFWFRHKLDVTADEAWRKVVAHCGGRALSSGYAEGFHTGYVEYVAAGGDGIPPTTPPYCMRCDVLRSPERQQLIIDYYAGYKHGTDVAKFEGLRDLVVVPLGRPPQPTSPGFTVTGISKNDPRQPDPFAPQTPLSTAFNDPPTAGPRPEELPTPRRAPVTTDRVPDAPAVTPMPVLPGPAPVAPAAPPVLAPRVVPPAPMPLDQNKLPVLKPEPEPETPTPPMPDPSSRLRSSQSSLGNGSPRPLPVTPPAYAPVPIQPPPTVVPVMAIPGEEAEPPTPRPTAAPSTPAARPVAPAPRSIEVPTPPSLPDLSVVIPVAAPIPTVTAPVPATLPPVRPLVLPTLPDLQPVPVLPAPTVRPTVRPSVRRAPQPVAEPVDGPVTGTADGLDEADQPGETRGTTSTRDLDSLRSPAAPSSSEDDDDR